MLVFKIIDPIEVDTPPTGKVTIFVDETNGKLSAKLSDDTIKVISDTVLTT